jgi:hypothetical protein
MRHRARVHFFDDSIEGPTPIKRVYRDVSFDKGLLRELQARKLFYIDWRRARGIKALPEEPER